MDINEIMNIIPHRPPFLLIDKIIDIEEGKRAVGIKNVTMNEPHFVGHFPNNPVMPGVLIIEALAQVGATLILSDEKYKGKTAYFAGIDKVRFKRKVIPGDVLILEVEVIKIRGPIGICKAIAKVNEEIAVVAELTVAIGD